MAKPIRTRAVPDDADPDGGAGEIVVLLPAGMRLPESLHLDVDNRGRVHAYWNGLGWMT